MAIEDVVSNVFAVFQEIRQCTNVYVDDETIHMEGDTCEVEEKVYNTIANFRDEVWLLQLKMSRTERGKERQSNMFLSDSILESRFGKLEPRRENWNFAVCTAHRCQFRGMSMVLTMWVSCVWHFFACLIWSVDRSG